MTDEVFFMASDISIRIFLLNKDWTFDVCKDERVAIVIFYTEIKIPQPARESRLGGICYGILHKRKTLVFAFISSSDFEPYPKVAGSLWQPVLLEAP